jgi:hypothetical protein
MNLTKRSQDLERLFKKVKDGMGWEDDKTTLWFTTINPHLGNVSPMKLINCGRAHKLESFIDGCLDENKPSAPAPEEL